MNSNVSFTYPHLSYLLLGAFLGLLSPALLSADTDLASRCNALAGSESEPGNHGSGVPFGSIDGTVAVRVCEQVVSADPSPPNLFRLGRALQANERFEEAASVYRRAAEQGYTPAQTNLGSMYSSGQGVAQDDSQAVLWFRHAAEQGFSVAQNNLGFMYFSGRGVAQDDAQAVQWFRLAAEQGLAYAQNGLGFMYDTGRGVTQDHAQAVQWYRLAAEQGMANAQFNLGRMYSNGQGVTQDNMQAIQWYRRAAEQGHVDAQTRLRQRLAELEAEQEVLTQDYIAVTDGIDDLSREVEALEREIELQTAYIAARAEEQPFLAMLPIAERGHAGAQVYVGVSYEHGRGIAQDLAQAAQWYHRAAEQGSADAQHYLGDLYAAGRGVARNEAEAVKWWTLAARQGDQEAQRHLRDRGLDW